MPGTSPPDPLLRVRPARDADLEALVDMLADDELGRNRELPGRPLARCYREALAEVQRDPNAEIVVLERGGEVVGTLQLNFLRGLGLQGARRAQIQAVRI